MLNKLEGVSGMEVRTREQLHSVDGLIIPGGAFNLLFHIEFLQHRGALRIDLRARNLELTDGRTGMQLCSWYCLKRHVAMLACQMRQPILGTGQSLMGGGYTVL